MNSFQSLIYKPADGVGLPNLQVLDQLLLPREKAYMDVKNVQDAWKVIRDMNVRGAPLIAIVAALGLAVDATAQKASFTSTAEAAAFVVQAAEYLKTSRPTAVNLFTAMDQMIKLVREGERASTDGGAVVDMVVREAERLLKEDVESNEAIGSHGAAAILHGKQGPVKVLTHCNTGSLATAGFGTALGVIRAINAQGRLERVFNTETRPYNQGSRLTSFEVVQDGLPGTLITDSMAAFLMAQQGLHAVVVGADRIAANGDTANKIGTYQLAVVAKHHGVPFYIAAPFTSFDLSLASGKEIVIEERPAKELTYIQNVQLAPDGIGVWNPGFDVTPAELITGIITERGVVYPSSDPTSGKVWFDVHAFLRHTDAKDGIGSNPLAPPAPFPTRVYEAMSEARLADFLAHDVPGVWAKLGAKSHEDIKITEVGDGNLNLVFIVLGPREHVVVKQALPYVRCVGESWPLTLERAFFEYEALLQEYKYCPEHTPEVYYFNKELALIVMRYIEEPHLILRKALIRGDRLSTMAHDLGVFIGRTLFFTSNLHLTGPEKREKVAFWSRNHALCALTEAVIFSEPYFESPNNRWTSPQLDAEAKAIREDLELKLCISRLKAKFMESTEALLHGDLHTGSVMVKEGSTFVIDPEFAFYGPMGFDTGALLANFFLSYLSQPGHKNGAEYAQWVLDQAVEVWTVFTQTFLELWEDEEHHRGEMFKRCNFRTPECLRATQEVFMASLLADTLGFAGAKMIRRVLGVAHVEDLESIADKDKRASCERHVLRVARELAVNAKRFATIKEVADFVRDSSHEQ